MTEDAGNASRDSEDAQRMRTRDHQMMHIPLIPVDSSLTDRWKVKKRVRPDVLCLSHVPSVAAADLHMTCMRTGKKRASGHENDR